MLVLLEHRVIDRQHRAARIAEEVLDALIGERLDHHFGAGHFPVRRRRAAVILRHRPLHTLAISGNQKGAKSP